MGEPREYGPKGGTVLFLDLLATFPPNLSEIDQNTVPALGTVLQGVPHTEYLRCFEGNLERTIITWNENV